VLRHHSRILRHRSRGRVAGTVRNLTDCGSPPRDSLPAGGILMAKRPPGSVRTGTPKRSHPDKTSHRNRLLAALPASDRHRMSAPLRATVLKFHDILHRKGERGISRRTGTDEDVTPTIGQRGEHATSRCCSNGRCDYDSCIRRQNRPTRIRVVLRARLRGRTRSRRLVPGRARAAR